MPYEKHNHGSIISNSSPKFSRNTSVVLLTRNDVQFKKKQFSCCSSQSEVEIELHSVLSNVQEGFQMGASFDSPYSTSGAVQCIPLPQDDQYENG